MLMIQWQLQSLNMLYEEQITTTDNAAPSPLIGVKCGDDGKISCY
jgi:hypothetical protein